ncbi:MAG: hypothetical protein QNK37_04915 [Acidobacteriota bacterium]|nr:hypothetical protein [Acidobacteriota bacterium]
MFRTVRISLENVVLEKTVEIVGTNLDKVREGIVALLADYETVIKPKDLEINDNWSRGFIEARAAVSINQEKLEPPRPGVIIISVRHDYCPGPVIQEEPETESAEPAPKPKPAVRNQNTRSQAPAKVSKPAAKSVPKPKPAAKQAAKPVAKTAATTGKTDAKPTVEPKPKAQAAGKPGAKSSGKSAEPKPKPKAETR